MSLQAALDRAPGVLHADVNLLLNRASVRYDVAVTGPRAVIEAVEESGFGAALSDSASDGRMSNGSEGDKVAHILLQKLTTSLTFTVPVVLIAKFGAGLATSCVLGFPLNELLKWVLTTPVQFVVARDFHVGAITALRRGAANMDVLVSLGTTASYLYSVVSILHHHFNAHRLSSAHPSTRRSPHDALQA